MSDHGPMVIEALDRLCSAEERPAVIARFLRRYSRRLRDAQDEPDPSLSDFAARVRVVRAAIDRDGVAATLERHARDGLAETLAGAAFHGVIRVGHAARGLARDDHGAWRDELARALVYAAIRGERLPQRPASGETKRAESQRISMRNALSLLAPSPKVNGYPLGLITPTLLARAEANPSLAAVSAQVRHDPDPSVAAQALCFDAAYGATSPICGRGRTVIHTPSAPR